MKKRLRKKLRLQEFQDVIFHVRFDLTIPNTDEANDAFIGKLFSFIEGNSFLINGSITDFYTQPEHRRSATEADRQLLQAWLEQQPEIINLRVGPLVDAWYGPGQHLSRPGVGMPNVAAAHIMTQAQISF